MEAALWLFLATVNDHREGLGVSSFMLTLFGVMAAGLFHGAKDVPDALRKLAVGSLVVGIFNGALVLWVPELKRVECLLRGVCG